jgi:ABC-type Na+ transport system ATPase subunit NatA
LSEVERTCDRVIIINKGQVVLNRSLHAGQNAPGELEELFVRITGEEEEVVPA